MLLNILASSYLMWTNAPLFAILALIAVFVHSAGVLLIININFLALIYVVVYVGAICILFLFVVMLMHLRLSNVTPKPNKLIFLLGFYLFFVYLSYVSGMTVIESNILDLVIYDILFIITEVKLIAFLFLSQPLTFIILTIIMLLAIIVPVSLASKDGKDGKANSVLRYKVWGPEGYIEPVPPESFTSSILSFFLANQTSCLIFVAFVVSPIVILRTYEKSMEGAIKMYLMYIGYIPYFSFYYSKHLLETYVYVYFNDYVYFYINAAYTASTLNRYLMNFLFYFFFLIFFHELAGVLYSRGIAEYPYVNDIVM